MDSAEASRLYAVVEGKAIELEIKAQGQLAEAGKFPAKVDAAIGTLQQAYKYRAFLEVMQEIVKQTTHHTITVSNL